MELWNRWAFLERRMKFWHFGVFEYFECKNSHNKDSRSNLIIKIDIVKTSVVLHKLNPFRQYYNIGVLIGVNGQINQLDMTT